MWLARRPLPLGHLARPALCRRLCSQPAGECCALAPPARPGLQVLEETGLQLPGARFATAVNTVFPSGKHYVTIFMQVGGGAWAAGARAGGLEVLGVAALATGPMLEGLPQQSGSRPAVLRCVDQGMAAQAALATASGLASSRLPLRRRRMRPMAPSRR